MCNTIHILHSTSIHTGLSSCPLHYTIYSICIILFTYYIVNQYTPACPGPPAVRKRVSMTLCKKKKTQMSAAYSTHCTSLSYNTDNVRCTAYAYCMLGHIARHTRYTSIAYDIRCTCIAYHSLYIYSIYYTLYIYSI